MNVALIIIGDELLSGQTQDCNMLYLGKKIRKVGHALTTTVVIEDKEEKISEAFNYYLDHFDLVFCSGGLGPTKDDRTKKALAHFLQTELQENQDAYRLAELHYERRGLTWRPELNHYHVLPRGVKPVENPFGLAPGLLAKKNKATLLCAPGVPREFEGMVDNFIQMSDLFTTKAERKTFTIRTQGIPEEQIFNQKCPDLWEALSAFGEVSSYPRLTGIDIVISNICLSQDEIKKQISQLSEITPINDHIWHLGNGHLEDLIVEYAKRNNLTISSAESCTGGLIAHLITSISGSSEVFNGTVVSYANSAKINLIQVSEQTIKKFGAVSEEVAREMAEGARKVLATDYAVSTSGVAGPLGGSEEKPVGTVAMAVSGPKETVSKLIQVPRIFDRAEMKERFAAKAMVKLFKQMKLGL